MSNVISIRENELDTQLTEAEYLISILEDKLSRLEADYMALQQEIIISNELVLVLKLLKLKLLKFTRLLIRIPSKLKLLMLRQLKLLLMLLMLLIMLLMLLIVQ